MTKATFLAAANASESTAASCIVRVDSEDDLRLLEGLEPEKVCWLEVPCELAHRPELNDFSVDVMLSDPEHQAAGLYELARAREPLRPRISMTTVPGFALAARVALSLQFPLRLIPRNPGPAEVQALKDILHQYLQGPASTACVEPFRSALATLLHGEVDTLWDALDENPAWIEKETLPVSIEDHLSSMLEQKTECARCRILNWCAGWFKWPDKDYDCREVRDVFFSLEAKAEQLRADLKQAEELLP